MKAQVCAPPPAPVLCAVSPENGAELELLGKASQSGWDLSEALRDGWDLGRRARRSRQKERRNCAAEKGSGVKGREEAGLPGEDGFPGEMRRFRCPTRLRT